MSTTLQQLNDDIAALAREAGRSLVQVRSGRRGTGAGIIWSSDGLIITNAHVIRRHSPQIILADGREFPSRILGVDPENDLAALAIEAADLPAVEPGDSQALRSGERVSLFFKHQDSAYSACMLGEVRWVAPFADANGATAGCVAGFYFRNATSEILPLLLKG